MPIKGRPLIEHVIDRAQFAGADEFFVVSGFRGDELRRHLDTLSANAGPRITHVINDEWHRANGVSVLKAYPYLDGNFVLTMCDHLVDPQIMRGLMAGPPAPDGVSLAVDFNLANPLIDLDDVTRVSSIAGRIERIGKLITDYNCFDTGVFLCTPAIFSALEESQSMGDDSISGAINMLARAHKAYTFDIENKLWIDVDDAAAFHLAETLLESGRL